MYIKIVNMNGKFKMCGRLNINITLGDLEQLYNAGYAAELNNGCCINILKEVKNHEKED